MASRETQVTRSNQVLVVLFLLGTAGLNFVGPKTPCAVCQTAVPVSRPAPQENEDPAVALIRAREKTAATQKEYDVIKRLSKTGSSNLQDLRIADMRRKIALLDYSSLLKPERADRNLVLKAKVILKFREEELAVLTELFQTGSVSEVAYQRAVSAREIAESKLKAIKSATETQRRLQLIKIAKSKLEVAEREFKIAQQLYASHSINQQTLDLASSRLKIAAAELASSKENLGARATQVFQ